MSRIMLQGRVQKVSKPPRPATPPAPAAPVSDVSVISPNGEKRALVLGGAECVWNDLARLEAMLGRPWDGIIIAVNDIGCHLPRVDHWVTLHGEKMGAWQKERRANGHPDGYITWTRKGGRAMDRQVQGWSGGASGLLAVAAAYELGCERVVLCGVPMSKAPHFAESKVHQRGKDWSSVDSHWKKWKDKEVTKRMMGRVKSMSGRTAELLGEPDAEFLGLKRREVA